MVFKKFLYNKKLQFVFSCSLYLKDVETERPGIFTSGERTFSRIDREKFTIKWKTEQTTLEFYMTTEVISR